MSKIYGTPVVTPVSPAIIGDGGGANGKSAYELAVAEGFEGTLTEWLESLNGDPGPRGPIPIKGVDYFTDAEVEEIAASAAEKVTPDGIGARPNTWTPTAQDVGARPDNWMPTAQEVGARPNTWMPTAQEVGARPNTWMPTASDVGAAPSGYGLGGAVLKEWANIDSIKAPGWYKFSGACGGSFGTFYSPFMRVDAADTSHCSQYIYPHGDIAIVLTRRITNNVWGEWEWENPPMAANGEYRTRKRYTGSPIYTKYINCGKMPVGTASGPNTIKVNTGVDHSKIVDWRIHIFNDDEYCTLPFISSGEIGGDAWLSGSQVHLRSFRDLSTYSVHMVIDYIK